MSFDAFRYTEKERDDYWRIFCRLLDEKGIDSDLVVKLGLQTFDILNKQDAS